MAFWIACGVLAYAMPQVSRAVHGHRPALRSQKRNRFAFAGRSCPGAVGSLSARRAGGASDRRGGGSLSAAIRRERVTKRTEERAHAFGATFIDHLMRFKGNREDVAAGVAAHVIRRWKDPEHRAWFARCMRTVAEMIEENREMKVPLLELPRTTVGKLKEARKR